MSPQKLVNALRFLPIPKATILTIAPLFFEVGSEREINNA